MFKQLLQNSVSSKSILGRIADPKQNPTSNLTKSRAKFSRNTTNFLYENLGEEGGDWGKTGQNTDLDRKRRTDARAEIDEANANSRIEWILFLVLPRPPQLGNFSPPKYYSRGRDEQHCQLDSGLMSR
jgi:hypothetical protein